MTIKLRKDTAAQWTSVNPVLASAQPGYETDTGKMKIGDGATNWSALGYFLSGTGGGGGSVTSAELLAEISNRTSADNALSTRIDTQSQGISVLSQQISVLSARVATNSAQMTSANNAISNAVSIVSAAVASEISNRTSADNALSSQIATNSAQMTSADNAISNAVSVVSAAINVVSNALSAEIVNRTSADNTLSGRIDTQSQGISVLSQQLSVLSARVASNSAQMTSADNAISNAVSIVSAAVASEISNRGSAILAVQGEIGNLSLAISALSTRIDTVSNALSAKKLISLADVSGTPSDQQIPMWNSAAAKFQFSTVATGTGSVTSAELLVEVSDRISADNALSVRIDTQSQGISVLSQQISVLSARVAGISAQMTSADNAISNAVSIVSVALASEISNRGSAIFAVQGDIGNLSVAISALSTRIDTVSNALSTKKLSSLADVTITSPISAQFLVYNSVKGKWENLTVAAGSGSVTSAELLVEISNRTSADNALSTRIDTQSQGISVLSQQISVLSARVESNSAQMTSADNAISAAVVAVSALISTVASALSARIDVVSNALSAKKLSSLIDVSVTSPVSAQFLIYKSAEGKWANSTIAAGSGSVTSAELLVEISNRTSADNALSVRIDTQSQGISVLSQQLSVLSARVASNSAQMTSADNAISNAVSVLSQQISVLSQQVSVLSARVAGISAQMTSADNAISAAVVAKTISTFVGVSIATVTDGQALVWKSASSQWVNSTIAGGSGFSEYDAGIASTTSVVINWSNGAAQKLSIVANTPMAAPTNFSAGGRYFLRIVQDSTGGRTPTWAATWVWPNSVAPNLGGASSTDILAFYSDGTNLYGSYNSDLSAFQQAASVLSQQLSVLSQQASVLSANLASLSLAVSALSTQISATNAQTNRQIRIVSDTQSNATSTLAKISGLVLSVAADQTWEITGMILVSTSAAGAGVRIGISGGVFSLPRFAQFFRLSTTGQSAGILGAAGLMAVSGTSTYLSAANLGGVIAGISYDAIVNVASAGTFRLMYAAIASATASPVHIMPGSYLKAERLK